MANLSDSAIIVIVVVVSGFLVTILWTFSGYFRRNSTTEEATTQISHSQDLYMREVRQRNQKAYAETVFGDGKTPTRPSQVWSSNQNNHGEAPPMATGRPGWGAPKRSNSYGQNLSLEEQGQGQSQSSAIQQEKDGSRVNYSAYEEAEYFEQSPYQSNDYYYYGHEQQQQPQQEDEKTRPIPPEQQV